MSVDTYFLINWIDEDEDDLYDVVSTKSVVPPEGTNILNVIAGSVCRVAYSGQYYRAKVINLGELIFVAK